MKFSPKLETYESLPGVKPWNQWCPVPDFTDQKIQNAFWSVNDTYVMWPIQKFAVSWQMLLPTLWKVSKSMEKQNLFFSNFSILWHHFCLFSKVHEWKGKNWRHIFFESFFHVLSRCKNVMLLIWWSYGITNPPTL